MIMYYMNNYGSFDYLYNCQGASVTRDQIGSNADYCEDTYSYATVFFKDHDVPWSCGYNTHYKILDSNSEGAEDSLIIFGNTTANEHDFVFLWACGTAQIKGGDCSCGYGRGMPYCWLHDNTLADFGHNETTDSDTEVFLGFINWSLDFTTETGYDSCNYGEFAVRFYGYLLENNYTVKEALNAASDDTLGAQYFGDTDLCNGIDIGGLTSSLRVYGNGDLGLP